MNISQFTKDKVQIHENIYVHDNKLYKVFTGKKRNSKEHILNSCEHLNLVLQKDIIYCNDGTIRQYPYIKQPDLLETIDTITLDDFFLINTQLIDAIGFLHKMNIAHMDIKLENMIYKDKIMYLLDFEFVMKTNKLGLAKLVNVCGTLQYLSPEMCDSKIGDIINCKQNDIWNIGLSLYMLKTKRMPYNKEQKNYYFKDWSYYYDKKSLEKYLKLEDEELSDMILDCIHPTKRPTIEELTELI